MTFWSFHIPFLDFIPTIRNVFYYYSVLTITSRFSSFGQLFKTISTCNNKLLIHFSYGGAFWIYIVAKGYSPYATFLKPWYCNNVYCAAHNLYLVVNTCQVLF